MPSPTLTCLSWSSAARKAAASAHRTELEGEAAEEAVADEGAVDGVLPEEVPLPDPHPAVSSARQHTTMTIFHRVALVRMPGLISLPGCCAARRLRLTLGGLFPAPGLHQQPDGGERANVRKFSDSGQPPKADRWPEGPADADANPAA